jgi:hypothetical protein
MKYRLLKDLKKGGLIDVDLGEGVTEEVMGGRWKYGYGDGYWYIDDLGEVEASQWMVGNSDKWRYSQGNCFKTEEEAEEYLEYLKIEGELRELADDDQVWDGAKNIWHHHLYYYKDSRGGKVVIDSDSTGLCNNFYFKSLESAQAAIEEIGEKRLIKYFSYGKKVQDE